MVKVMLVDDEPLILEGLKNIINWESFGFKVVSIASHGKEAIEKYKANPADLVITDVKMPNMGGLELIKALKAENNEVKSIVLSGFQEFDYVKKGLELGIENYLLKPVDQEELLLSLKGVKEKINNTLIQQKSSLVMRDQGLWRWINGQMSFDDLRQRLSFYTGMDITFPINIGLLKIECQQSSEILINRLQKEMEKREKTIAVVSPLGHMFFLWCGIDEDKLKEEIADLKKRLKKDTEKGEYILVYSKKVKEPEKIHDAFKEIEMASELKMLLPKQEHKNIDYIYFKESKNVKEEHTYLSNHLSQEIIEKITEGEYDLVEKELGKTFDYYNSQNLKVIVKSILLELLFFIKNNFFLQLEHEQYVKKVHAILNLQSVEEAKITLTHCIELLETSKIEDKSKHSPIIETILKHIHQNYAEDMSLKTLGALYHISPIYLGQLFQKEVNYSFTKYLNSVRIKKAKEYLLNSYEKAGSIGNKVGYADPAYFYKQFKKQEKMTPSQWRKKYTKTG
ncbi:response regulator transcription factor [Proteinivorax tanatarense]|uniref:Stage 0 sporulation protein A homolog n=1 Tax=Proteinivorax tanatarense TaxID=1260629 RepID=A0AAU7VJQ9_9FIRM